MARMGFLDKVIGAVNKVGTPIDSFTDTIGPSRYKKGDRVAEEGDRAEGRIAGIERKLEGSPGTDTELFALEVGGELRGTRIRTGRMERLRLGMPVLLRTLLSQRAPSGRRNYLYTGEGSVIGLTDTAGELQTSYSYDPYGHPPNLSSLGDENPFGYRGAYTAGVQTAGVIWGAPNQDGGGYYDAEDGRFGQLTPLVFKFELPSFTLDLDLSLGAGVGGEVGVEIDQDFRMRPYVGGGGGLGGGASVMMSFGESKSGRNGGGCLVACAGAGKKGASVGVGPKAGAGIYYRQYLDEAW
jgi:hypothetical protein